MKAFLLGTVLGILFLTPYTTNAIILPKPFGGTVMFIVPCTCPLNGIALYIRLVQKPYFTTLLWKPPLTQIYANYFPYYGVSILGKSMKTIETCNTGVSPYCYNVPVKGLITELGTSF